MANHFWDSQEFRKRMIPVQKAITAERWTRKDVVKIEIFI